MSVKANAADAAQAWVTAMQGAGTKYTAGINAVKVSPGQLAAAASGLWAQNVAASQQKFATKVASVTLPAWQAAAINKGAPRLGTGATAAQPKMQAFMQSFLPTLTNIVNSLPAGGTFEQNMQRFQSYATSLHAAAGTF
jgi:hypothetical protein